MDTKAKGMKNEDYRLGYGRGYGACLRDVVALLKTGRTIGGETITGAEHAAIVIARGDALGVGHKDGRFADLDGKRSE